jgi:hypothetical protein
VKKPLVLSNESFTRIQNKHFGLYQFSSESDNEAREVAKFV